MATDGILETEVCVVGGGPAGAVTSLKLARLGHDVCLIEREAFPRMHVGESLPPSILPLLDVLGLRDRIEAADFLRPQRAIVQWVDDEPFEKPTGPEPGFQVDRGRFDKILLDAAVRDGVRVMQPASAMRPARDKSGRWRIPVATSAGIAVEIRARFLVDAVGKRSLLGGDTATQSPPTIALYGYWRSHGIAGPETRVEAGDNQWYWGAPLPDRSFNATVFIDPKSCSSKAKSGLESAYRALVDKSRLLSLCLSGRLIAPVRACDATCRSAVESIGPDWIKVGEAAFSIDPLSSQGVQTAMRTALQAAVVVHTILTRPQNTAAANEFYQQQQQESVTRNQQVAAQFYAEHAKSNSAPFWEQRASVAGVVHQGPPLSPPPPALDTVVCLANDIRIEPTPVIDGDLIDCRPALIHPALPRPVAYLHGIAIDDLLTPLGQPRTVFNVLRQWSGYLPPHADFEVLRWLWNRRIVTSVGSRYNHLPAIVGR